MTKKTEKMNNPCNLNNGSLIPIADPNFIPWGHFNDLTTIFKMKLFYPAFITGMSGNGKTTSVIEAAAKTNRELIRINFTIETDEDDLLGSMRLIDGNTVWEDGPVVTAMKRGAVLLLDELSLASHKCLALMPILEGKPVYLKKTNEIVRPAPGFTIVATDNTKGRGSQDGRFVGTNVMNEALLDRFAVTFLQPYANEEIEAKIAFAMAESLNLDTETHKAFINRLVRWGDLTRKSFENGGTDDLISTRRVLDAIKAFSIFNDETKSIVMVTERFDEETKKAFRDLHDSLVPSDNKEIKEEEEEEPEENVDDLISQIPW